jgi:hypothetical protein
MSQSTHTVTIETNGEDLADQLQQWRDALQTSHRGAARPAYAVPGLLWIKEVSSTIWQVYLSGNAGDGSLDALLATYNPTTGILAVNSTGMVATTRTISAGTGLSGGGDLSANRTLQLDLGTQNNWTKQQYFGTQALAIVSSAVAWNLQTQQKARLTLSSAPTMSAPSNMVDGGEYSLTFIQNGTGGYTPAWNSVFKGLANLELDVAANAITRTSWECDATYMYLTGCLSGIGA